MMDEIRDPGIARGLTEFVDIQKTLPWMLNDVLHLLVCKHNALKTSSKPQDGLGMPERMQRFCIHAWNLTLT